MNTSPDRQKPRTILVVDDMAMCRESIADILRTRGYEVVLADSGEEALAHIARRSIDLMMLDVMMRGLDGLSVLKLMRRHPRWSSLPVIMLTDAAELDTVRSAARVGVQGYLLKSSFSVDQLVALVEKHLGSSVSTTPSETSTEATARVEKVEPSAPEQVCTTPAAGSETAGAAQAWGVLNKDEVLKKIQSQLQLRPVPPVLQYVIAQTHNKESSFDEVVSTVRQDQALALRVMKVANSSFYATGKRAQNLIEAAQRIGMSGIRNAVTAILAIDHFSGASSAGLVPQRFWQHCLATAALAQSLGEAIESEDAEELFLSGLLHDLGRLVLSCSFPEQYQRVLETSEQQGLDPVVVEQSCFHLHHGDVTRKVLDHLQMAQVVVASAAAHERSLDELKSGMRGSAVNAAIVGLANRMAHALALGNSGSAMLLPMDGFARFLGIEPRRIAEIARDVAQKTTDIELFYASQSDEQFREPFVAELRKRTDRAPRVAVIADSPDDHCCTLLFEQLGWSSPDNPEVAILGPTSGQDMGALMEQLEVLERKQGVTLPAVVALASDDCRSWPPEGSPRQGKCVHVPTPYDCLLDVVVRLCASTTMAT